jgi:hypothetical protein
MPNCKTKTSVRVCLDRPNITEMLTCGHLKFYFNGRYDREILIHNHSP